MRIRQFNVVESMPTGLCGFKNYANTQDRQHRNNFLVLLIPGILAQLQYATPGCFPFFGKINNDIQPAMKLRRGVVIEVYVRSQRMALLIIMSSTPKIFRVENQVFYASYRLNIFGETRA